MAISLDPTQIASLLNKAPERKYPVRAQEGPLRFVDTQGRCASRGCSSPTHMKVKGIYYCSMHTMIKLNDMLIEAGIDNRPEDERG